MVLFEDASDERPMTGAGVRDIIEEEEVERPADSTPAPRSDAGAGVDEDAPSPTRIIPSKLTQHDLPKSHRH